MSELTEQLNQCIERFKLGQLTEQHLREALALADNKAPHPQDLLYLQTSNTGINAPVHGMGLVQNGQWSDGPVNASDWPYRTVLEAIRDGWRVIQFPNLGLLLDESRTYGLGCEFILER